MENRFKNIDLGKTQITNKIRVSSAAIFYDEWFGRYYQLETFIFSDDKRQRTRMFIHGTTLGTDISNRQKELVASAHRRISKIMFTKFNPSGITALNQPR